MSMNMDNNLNPTYNNSNTVPGNGSMPANGDFRTAGQAMQPPILSPSTVTRPPVSMQANPMQQQMPTYRPVLTPEALSSHTVPASPATAVAAPVSRTTAGKQKKAKKEKKAVSSQKASGSGRRIVAVAVAFCILGAGLATCGMVAYGLHWAEGVRSDAVAAAKKTAQKNSNSNSSASNKSTTVNEGSRDYTVINTSTVDTSELHTASEIYAANVNSMVGITTSIDYGYYEGGVTGSGFILTSDGYIVTNYHVVEDGKTVQVTTYDNKTYDATVVGYDESNDLAVLKIDADDLTPVILGDSDKLNVGDDVIAIGNALGELSFSLTKGCVSALNRPVDLDNNLRMSLIQTDCAINSGNSGGALFNMYGEVIGITNAKYSNNGDGSEAAIESIAFAIPISSVRSIIDSIIEKGYVEKPYIGVYAETVTAGSNYGASEGIGISSIVDNSPAERAGIKGGDVIIKINGEEVSDVMDLKMYINRAGVGGQLELTIIRDGKEIEIVVDVEADEAS
ncbi:MAG: trypsin-like peptidase domain-containing protein [Clostridiales bacterium]|nr:trypsin-like peptidase domain-containing protein [Clostridiales bacterium]